MTKKCSRGVIPQREKGFQAQVIRQAKLYGWRVAHFRTVQVQRRRGGTYHATPVVADGKGFPDLVLVRERVLFVELKTDIGRLKPEQEVWGESLRAAGADVRVWRPRDWAEIVEALKR